MEKNVKPGVGKSQCHGSEGLIKPREALFQVGDQIFGVF